LAARGFLAALVAPVRAAARVAFCLFFRSLNFFWLVFWRIFFERRLSCFPMASHYWETCPVCQGRECPEAASGFNQSEIPPKAATVDVVVYDHSRNRSCRS
jgi:hypothetical protein